MYQTLKIRSRNTEDIPDKNVPDNGTSEADTKEDCKYKFIVHNLCPTPAMRLS